MNKQDLVIQALVGIHSKSGNMVMRIRRAIILAILRGFEPLGENYLRKFTITDSRFGSECAHGRGNSISNEILQLFFDDS